MRRTSILIVSFLALAGSASAAMTFVHPGALDGKTNLDFVKAQIQAGKQPWTGMLNTLNSNENLAAAPSPLTQINSNNGDANTSRNDARRAYGNALAWYYTGDTTYAKQAIAILNAWSILQDFDGGNDQDKLQAGWIGALFGPAADIMLGYSGWASEDISNLRAMFKLAFYPQLNTASSWNGNVDLTQIDAMMAISVFEEDETEFDLGLQRLGKRDSSYFYLASEGPNGSTIPPISGDGNNIPAFWSNPTGWVDGLTQETCRDNDHHTQFAMSAAMGAAEVAWHQGVDVYTTYQQRYVAMEELMALQITSGSMQGTCADSTSTSDLYDTWEIGYNHYHFRKGLAMPNTWKLIS